MRDYYFILKVVTYYNENKSTVRATAKHFGISKTTVYNYLTVYLPNPTSAAILEKNKKERHIRGGMATKLKYQKKSSN